MTQWHHLKPAKLLVPESIGILISSTVGAGIFGLPFVFAQAGFLTGLLVLVVLAFSNILINLLIGEMSLSTKEPEHLVGLSQKYLGNFGKIGTFITLGIGIYGALLAYLIGEGQVLSALSGDNQPLFFSIIFFIFASILVYLGLDFLRRAELWIMGMIFIAAVVVAAIASPHLELANLNQFHWQTIFLPYGAVFFALLGGSAVPSMRKVLVGHEKYLKKSIIWGSIIPVILYIIFTFIIVGVAGIQTTEVATVGLGDLIGRSFLIVSNIFAVLVMATSFLTLGVTMSFIYQNDLGLSRGLAWVLTCLPPLLAVLLGFHSFITAISLAGALSGGLQGGVLLYSYYRFKKQAVLERTTEYRLRFYPLIIAWLSLVFLGGLVFVFVTLR